MNEPVEPVAERTISDVETLKALSDPVRLRILETMVAGSNESWTVKRLAAALGVGATKLYHHIKVLEEREFIRVAGTRVVSGIIETSYQTAQLSVRLDRALLSAGDAEGSTSVHEVMSVIFGAVQEDIERGIRSGLIGSAAGGGEDDPMRDLLIRGLTRLTPERSRELRARLKALLEEFDTAPGASTAAPDETAGTAGAAGSPFGFLVTLYPLPESANPEDSGD